MKDTRHDLKDELTDPSSETIRREPVQDDDSDLEFEVTEAHDQASDLVGGYATAESDSLGIESPADLLERSQNAAPASFEARPVANGLIGDSNPLIPTASKTKPTDEATLDQWNISQNPTDIPADEPTLEKLSDERVAEISRRMRVESGKSDYLSEEEKMNLVSGMQTSSSEADRATESRTGSRPLGFDNLPIVPPKRENRPESKPVDYELPDEKPQISKRIRGVAYFAKGYIKITGEQELHEEDELIINGREYQLRHKKVSNKTLMIVGGPVLALLIFALGTLFSSDADTGAGSIVGMLLDNYSQPVLMNAQIHLPQLNQTYTANSQGFFQTDRLDAGSYKIEYLVDGRVVATDFATVVNDRLTTLSLRPEEVQATGSTPNLTAQTSATPTPSAPVRTVAPAPPRPAASKAQATTSPTRSAPAKSSTPAPRSSKLTLAANIDGARLTLDNKVVGAGNLTFSELTPGRHTYVVEKDGYQTEGGSIELVAGKTAQLTVTLRPATVEEKAQTYASEDYYYSALRAISNGDYETAAADLNQAIETNPNYAEALLSRAEVNQQRHNQDAALDDYVRAAEAYQVNHQYGEALAAYQKGLDLNSKSILAYLGRGNLYLDRKEHIAAIADFDMVVRLDTRNLEGYLGLGHARYAQGYHGKAIKHFKDARSLDSENAQIYTYLMFSHFGNGDMKDVQKDYTKFLQYASEDEIRQLESDSRYAAIQRVLE